MIRDLWNAHSNQRIHRWFNLPRSQWTTWYVFRSPRAHTSLSNLCSCRCPIHVTYLCSTIPHISSHRSRCRHRSLAFCLKWTIHHIVPYRHTGNSHNLPCRYRPIIHSTLYHQPKSGYQIRLFYFRSIDHHRLSHQRKCIFQCLASCQNDILLDMLLLQTSFLLLLHAISHLSNGLHILHLPYSCIFQIHSLCYSPIYRRKYLLQHGRICPSLKLHLVTILLGSWLHRSTSLYLGHASYRLSIDQYKQIQSYIDIHVPQLVRLGQKLPSKFRLLPLS